MADMKKVYDDLIIIYLYMIRYMIKSCQSWCVNICQMSNCFKRCISKNQKFFRLLNSTIFVSSPLCLDNKFYWKNSQKLENQSFYFECFKNAVRRKTGFIYFSELPVVLHLHVCRYVHELYQKVQFYCLNATTYLLLA